MVAYAENLLVQDIPSYGTLKGKERRRTLPQQSSNFPTLFTVVAVMLFALPSWTLIWTSIEPAVAYWNTTECSWLLAIPLLILATHIYQVVFGANFFAVLVTLLAPSLLLVLMVMAKQASAGGLAQDLFSIDCHAFPGKASLELEWEAAHSFYAHCIFETAAKNNLSEAYLRDTFRIQDCETYPTVLRQHARTWGYLAQLEETSACTGWCIPGQQLWSRGPRQDSCSVAASAAFEFFVGPRLSKALAISGLTLIFSVVVLAIMPEYVGKGDAEDQ